MTARDDALAAVLHLEFAGLREQLAGPLGQFSNGLPVKGARPLQLDRLGSSPVLWTGDGRLLGWSVLFGTGGGTVTFYDSRDGSGDVLGLADGAEGATDTKWLGAGVSAGEALSAVVTGAVVRGVAYFQD